MNCQSKLDPKQVSGSNCSLFAIVSIHYLFTGDIKIGSIKKTYLPILL